MSSSTNITEKEQHVTLEIDVDSIKIENNSLFFEAISLTESFAPTSIMERDAWTGTGKELRWRHKLPEENVNDLIGHVHKSYYENGVIKTLSEVWGHRDDLLKIQEKLKKNELSISLGYKNTVDSEGNVVGIYIREQSLTPNPKCTPELGCKITSIIQTLEDKKMPENEGNDSATKKKQRQDNESLSILEQNTIKQNQERGERIVELEEVIETLENRLEESNSIIIKQKEKIESLEKENTEIKEFQRKSETRDIRKEIITLEKITDKKAIQERLEKLEKYPKDLLEDMRDSLQRALKVSGKSNRQAPVLGNESNTENESAIDKMSPEDLALSINPDLRSMIKQNENGGYKVPSPPAWKVNETGEVEMIERD